MFDFLISVVKPLTVNVGTTRTWLLVYYGGRETFHNTYDQSKKLIKKKKNTERFFGKPYNMFIRVSVNYIFLSLKKKIKIKTKQN